jgi:hypothetical protein
VQIVEAVKEIGDRAGRRHRLTLDGSHPETTSLALIMSTFVISCT